MSISIRRKSLEWLAKAFSLPIYFEVFPVSQETFDDSPRNITGFPTNYSAPKLEEALWPRPDRRYRVFVSPD